MLDPRRTKVRPPRLVGHGALKGFGMDGAWLGRPPSLIPRTRGRTMKNGGLDEEETGR